MRWTCFCVDVLKACLAADLLQGREDVSNFGKLKVAELPWVMAFFASRSAALLPSTPLWAGTHLICMSSLGYLLLMRVMAL